MDDNQTSPSEQVDAHAVATDQAAQEAGEGTHTRRTRTRRKKAEEAIEQAQREVAASGMAEGEIPNQKREWKAQFPVWEDVVAGVKLVEDRQDHNQIVYFRDRPPVAALDRLADEGWVRDDELGGYAKPVSGLHPRLQRSETQELVKDVANMIRAEIGAEQ